MSLGTGALNVGRRPEHFRPRQGGIHCNPMSGNHPCKHSAANWHRHTELDQCMENTHLTHHTYQRGLKHLTGREGLGLKLLQLCKLISMCEDQYESSKTHENKC